jgi:hypothetical protein
VILIRAEEKTRASFRADTGIWIEQLTTGTPGTSDAMGGGVAQPITPGATGMAAPGMSQEQIQMMQRRYGMNYARGAAETPAAAPAAPAGAVGGTNDVDVMNITFRAVGLSGIAPGANADTALELLTEIKNSPYFDASTNTYAGDISQEVPLNPNIQNQNQPGQPTPTTTSGDPPGTFSFKIVAKLKKPLKL